MSVSVCRFKPIPAPAPAVRSVQQRDGTAGHCSPRWTFLRFSVAWETIGRQGGTKRDGKKM